MRSISLFLALFGLPFLGNGQTTAISAGHALDHPDFNGRFAMAVSRDSASIYYLLDFARLASRFERVSFMELSFRCDTIVNVDPDIMKDQVLFKASIRYPETEVSGIFQRLQTTVNQRSAVWTREEKSAWLEHNDKYN